MIKAAYFRLSHAAIIEVTGKHAVRYLNNRFTNDVMKFAAQAPQHHVSTMRAGALNAQGRLEGLFTVVARQSTPNAFLLVCDAGKGDSEFMQALVRFKVADDVQFLPREDLMLIHSSVQEQRNDGVAWWSRNRGMAGGFDLLAPATLAMSGIEQSPEDCLRQRILSGEPQFGVDFDSDALLAEVDISDAISFTKGCYVGQEVVARIDALGRAPRVLVRCRVVGSAPLSAASIVQLGETRRVVGEVSSSIRDGDFQICFAFIRNDPALLASSALVIGDRSVTIFERQ